MTFHPVKKKSTISIKKTIPAPPFIFKEAVDWEKKARAQKSNNAST